MSQTFQVRLELTSMRTVEVEAATPEAAVAMVQHGALDDEDATVVGERDGERAWDVVGACEVCDVLLLDPPTSLEAKAVSEGEVLVCARCAHEEAELDAAARKGPVNTTERLEELLTAAFLQWAKGVSHERALELARSQRTPSFFRMIALASIARFCGKGDVRLLVVENDEPVAIA